MMASYPPQSTAWFSDSLRPSRDRQSRVIKICPTPFSVLTERMAQYMLAVDLSRFKARLFCKL